MCDNTGLAKKFTYKPTARLNAVLNASEYSEVVWLLSILGSAGLFDCTVNTIAILYPQLTVELEIHDGRRWGIIHGDRDLAQHTDTIVQSKDYDLLR